MQIKFNGKYTKDLFFTAMRIANEPARNSRIMYILVAMVFGVMTATTLQTLIQTRDFVGNIINIALIFLLGIVLYQAYLPPWLGARRLWTTELEQRQFKGYITKNGITYNFPNGDKVYEWSDFNRLRQAKGLITLVSITGMLLIFPDNFFKTDADWSRFKSIVEANIVVTKRK